MFKRKLVIVNTTILLSVGSLFAAPTTFANHNNSEITKIEKRLSETRNELSEVEEQIKRVEIAIKENNKMIAKTEKEINESKEEVSNLEEEIAQLNEKISVRTEILKQRVLSLQESGGNVAYLEVLFGSKDFSDFFDRLFAIMQIANADTELINEQEQDKQQLEDKQVVVNNKLAELEEMMVELEEMKEQTLIQKSENDKLKKELKKREKSDLNKKAKLEEEKRRAKAQRNTQQISRGGSTGGGAVQNTAPPVSYNGDIGPAITAGYKYIGRSAYKFGGGRTQYDIDNGLFDCSGFVSWSFRQAGISLPASTDALRNVGKRVPTSDMRPGDLVFFNTYKVDGHVGIYLGGGKFIGSQNKTGVAVADMSSGYWKQHFNGRVNRIN